jgi:hypothetical protein
MNDATARNAYAGSGPHRLPISRRFAAWLDDAAPLLISCALMVAIATGPTWWHALFGR